MSSKISGVDGAQTPSVGTGRSVQRTQSPTSGGAQGAAGGSGSQDVRITGAARQLATLEQKLRDLPVVNQARVSQIRRSIEQGTYAIRPEHIAEKLTQMEQALSKLPQGEQGDSSSDSNRSEQQT